MNGDMLHDKVCLVTGASRGIGRAIAECFANEGAFVYANIRSNDITFENTSICPLLFDVTKPDEIKSVLTRVKKETGRVDVLVNNAGMVTNEVIGMISGEKVKDMFGVNVFGLLDLTQYVTTRFMIKQKSGSVINISSIVAMEGSKGQVAYSASKGAVIALTKSAAKELSPNNIRVNSVAPGITETARILDTIEEQYKGVRPEIGMGRFATPQDIANACLFFASDLSVFVTGQILVVSGGQIV